MEVEGGCYCGAVRYRAEGEAAFKGQCHCRECQYISGGSPNLVLALPEEGFAYTKGSPASFKRSDLENPVTREFCGDCGTHMRSIAPGLPLALLKVGTLDNPADFVGPDMAIFTSDSQPFHMVAEGVLSFEGMPG